MLNFATQWHTIFSFAFIKQSNNYIKLHILLNSFATNFQPIATFTIYKFLSIKLLIK